MALGRIHKQKFNMKLTNTIKQRRWLMQVGSKWCDRLRKDILKLYMVHNLWKEAALPFLKYTMWLFVKATFTFFPRIPKWEFQNWDSCCPKTLDIHIFLKSSLFGTCKGNYFIALKKVFPMVHCMLQSEFIWPLL